MSTIVKPFAHSVFAILLFAGIAEAGNERCTVYKDSRGQVWKDCDSVRALTCEERMKEAMAAMDKLTKIELGTLATRNMQE